MTSLWEESFNLKERKSLKGNITTDIAVVGCGMAGALIAYMLQEEGKNVVVIEGDRIGNGNTKGTTGKITLQHNLIYKKLVEEFGIEKGKEYLRGNKLALEKFKELINSKNIECDFEEKDAYLYSLKDKERLEKELEYMRLLGLEGELVYNTPLPFEVFSALKIKKQGQFNPIKFLNYITKELDVYENSRVIDIKDGELITENGSIKAKNIVLATHFPIIKLKGLYFMKMHQERSYVLALENCKDVKGMYIDIDKDGYSFRNYKDLLLVCGVPQRTGENEKGGSYNKLREACKEMYPEGIEKYNWSSQDCMTLDYIPYIDECSNGESTIYAATGFNKWGMTSSMLSAMIISNKILGKNDDFSEIFSNKRFDMSISLKNLLINGYESGKNYMAEKVHMPTSELDDIELGHGGIINYNGEKVGVYKDSDGNIFMVDTKCPHLGCELNWNSDELTWDCPCHGSRFDYMGNVIDSPSTRGIKID